MSEPIHIDDGCSLSLEEVLARLKIGLKSDAELHPDYVDPENRTSEFLSPTDRALFLLALPSKGEGMSDLPEAPEQR